VGYELLDYARSDPAHAVGLAAVVTEGVLVEVGLQVLGVDRTGVRAQRPALQERDRSVATLDGVALAALGLGLHFRVVRPLAQALAVAAGMSALVG